MPDSQGRYTLTEMEGKVRTLLDAINQTLDASGNVTATEIVYLSVSNQDIDSHINESLIAVYNEAILGHDDLFAFDVYMDEKQGQINYSFPPNMLNLRWMRWKSAGLQPPASNLPNAATSPGAHPSDYIPMIEVFDPMDLSMSVGYYGSPTFRRNGDGFVLGRIPSQDNVQGMLLNIVALPALLTPSTASAPSQDVIRGLYARLSQEVVIYDAAYKLAATKLKQVSPEIEKGREEWHTRFFSAVENAFNAVSISMTSNRLVSSSYAGRSSSGTPWRRRTW
jgi:hypothetical protein